MSKKNPEIFEKIPESVQKDSGNYSERIPRIFQKIPVKLNLDLLREILLVFIKFYY